ncbi:MAG: hypothetical protein KI788_06305 [Mameliella sp.]|nr:hypothetical protein [Mameliella sp.]
MGVDVFPCANCGAPTHIDALDAKPERFAGTPVTSDMLSEADGEDFTRLECSHCYGPAYVKGP